MSGIKTLGQFIIDKQADFPYAKGELSRLLRDIGIAAKIVNREVNKAAVKQSKEQAKADYDVAIAAADGDQAIAIEKCKQQPADAKTACEQTANSVHDETVKSAMSKLELANQQAS